MSDNQDLQLTADDEARIDALLRSLTDDDLTLDTPPDSVWAGIEEALAAEVADAGETPAEVADFTAFRNRRLGIVAGAVAAAFVLVLGIGIVALNSGDDYREVAVAELVYDAETFDPGGAGHSAVTTWLEGDGEARVRFDAADLPQPVEGEDVELWLIGIDDAGEIAVIQTLGIVEDLDDPGTFDVPEGFSTDDYAAVAVDLSFEPRDGVETHSGRSILRGPLSA